MYGQFVSQRYIRQSQESIRGRHLTLETTKARRNPFVWIMTSIIKLMEAVNG